ncbi:XcyI family restriction endonuclease [Marinicella sediminis]|uniref:XcyI family restriction endonuclease n=1 Tax=Marinicella sediminis TaxID=1792834 RepID=A0ABV7J4X9_9GAMM|nr:XcyI family restriction endonuclease [Marinicella sediminis]
MSSINLPNPELQISFSYKLGQIREVYLQEALSKTIKSLDIKTLNFELDQIVPAKDLKRLAMKSLRAELMFPVPCLLIENPNLLGYYRLLLGFSQKEFYKSELGLSRFKRMETNQFLSNKNREDLNSLCKEFAIRVSELIDGVGIDRISKEFIDDLTLLTLGPQLRGGANNKRGIDAITVVFKIIKDIVQHAIHDSTSSSITLLNSSERRVQIKFAADPDIVIHEIMDEGFDGHALLAIEVKGGKDISNIHNRIGEAEKSHRKAKSDGYVECWTVINVDQIDLNLLKKESPTTNQFFRINHLNNFNSDEFKKFRNSILSLTGIRSV